MTSLRLRGQAMVGERDQRGPAVSNVPLLAGVAAGVFLAFYVILDRLGFRGLVTFAGALSAVTVLFIISFKSLQAPLLFWLFSLMGFRYIVYVPTPGLPDITLDRLAMLWVCAIFMIKAIGDKRNGIGRLLALDILILLHGVYLLVHFLVTNPTVFNLWQRSVLTPYVAYFMGRLIMKENRWIQICFALLFVLNIYYAATSVAEKFGWDFLVWPKVILNRAIGMQVPGRSRGIFLQSAVLGTIIGMLMCAQLYFTSKRQSRIMSLVCYASLVLSALGLYFTYTRGSWLAGIMSLLAMGGLGWKVYGSRLLKMGAVAALAIGLGLVSFAQDSFFKERMENEGTVTGRINTATTAFRMFQEKPLFGVGFRKYQGMKQEYRETITNVPFFGTIKRSQNDEASLHDIYLGRLAETGIVGMGLQVMIYFGFFALLRKKMSQTYADDDERRRLFPALGGMVVGYLVGGLAIDYVYFESVNGLCYFVMGLVAGHEGGTRRAAPEVLGPAPVSMLARPA